MLMKLVLRGCLGAMALAAITVSAVGQELEKVGIGLASSSLPGGVARLVKQMGLFEAQGLDVSVIPMENDSVAVSGLLSGSLDFVTTAGNQLAVSQSRGIDLVGIRAVYSNFPGVMVLAKSVVDRLDVAPDAPVPERFRALDGLVIATPGPTSSYTAVVAPAAEAGAKVRYTYMAQTAMVAALESGSVQGFVASAPFYAQPVLRETGVIWISGVDGEFENAPSAASILSSTRETIETRPELVQKVVQAFIDFSDAVAERPEDVKAAIVQVFPAIDSATLDLLFETGAKGFIGRPLTVEDMKHEIKFTQESGVPLPQPELLVPEKMIMGD
jgi:ABC-type nitrate/sulfonate/bicarbonate transport system substrate-binding protein